MSPWTVASQAPLSMGLYKQEYWSKLSFPSPRDLPGPGIGPTSLVSPELVSLQREPPGRPSSSLDLRKDSSLEMGKTTFPLLILITQRGTSQRSWWRATETGAVTELKYLPSVVCNRDWQAPLFWVNQERSLQGLCLVLLVLSLISVFTGPKCESGQSLVTTET